MRRLLSRVAFRRASLRARLVSSAALFVLAAIIVVGLVLNGVVERVVRGEIASRLDLQISTIAAEITAASSSEGPAGRGRREGPAIARAERQLETRRLDAPPFEREGSGWYWQVSARGAVLGASRSLDGERLSFEGERGPRDRGPPPRRLATIEGPDDRPLLLRAANVRIGGIDHQILATAPLAALTTPQRDAAATVALTLALLGAALVAAILLQVRFGLAPIEALRGQLNAVREGEADRVGGEQPVELAPLVTELNALIEQDALNLRQARLHVANLAHGLKTPLATLSAGAARMPDAESRQELLALTGLMDRRIRHHLRRAQTAALGGPARRRTDLSAHLADLAAMLRKFHQGTGIALRQENGGPIFVAVDAEDLDEMLGNLLDNAYRHARSAITVECTRHAREVSVRIADDGAGLSEGEIALVRQAGRRLDESEAGHGFGLPITIEIAELYGGRLELGRAPEGGLQARLFLPSPGSGARASGES